MVEPFKKIAVGLFVGILSALKIPTKKSRVKIIFYPRHFSTVLRDFRKCPKNSVILGDFNSMNRYRKIGVW